MKQNINGIWVFGEPLSEAVAQMENCLKKGARYAALMGDHHLGYSVPVGGVIAYQDAISPSAVGFDIACGNKAVKTNLKLEDIQGDMGYYAKTIFENLSFGVGRKNEIKDELLLDNPLFLNPLWDELPFLTSFREEARKQLGTIGSGNHYVDVFADNEKNIWVGCHFGSRGLGHKIASHFIKEGGGKDGINVDPAILYKGTSLYDDYIHAMILAGIYAYAGRDWVCSYVVEQILGGKILDEVHNHHNFAWEENHYGQKLWVVRKGATPCYPNQRGFIGSSMGENSIIVRGSSEITDDMVHSMFSTVHGAGRIMSRTLAAGKCKWVKGKKIRISDGCITQEDMTRWVNASNTLLMGGGVDESPHCYKRLNEVIDNHKNTLKIETILHPLIVCMAGNEVFDPYKD